MGTFLAKNFYTQPAPLVGDALPQLQENQQAVLELDGAVAPVTLTIADGGITPTSARVIVDTEGQAAADDLTTIGGAMHNGALLYLKSADASRVVTVKNSANVNGVMLFGGADVVLSTTWWLCLELINGSWVQVRNQADSKADATDALVTTTPTAGGIPKADSTGKLDPTWVDISGKLIGEIVYSAIPMTDAALHLLDGSTIMQTGMYAAGCTYIKSLQTSYPQLFTTEAEWQAGDKGKFVVDDTVGTIRLPLATGWPEGVVNVAQLGSLNEAGLPNITFTFSVTGDTLRSPIVNLARTPISGNATSTTRASSVAESIEYDAAEINSTYGNSTEVTPRGPKLLVYIVLATTTKTDITVDIDNITTDVNSKAAIADVPAMAAHAAMPSNRYIDLINPVNGTSLTYTAPADGYFECTMYASSSGGAIAGEAGNSRTRTSTYIVPSGLGSIFFPVLKNSLIAYICTGCIVDSINFTRFIYAEGAY